MKTFLWCIYYVYYEYKYIVHIMHIFYVYTSCQHSTMNAYILLGQSSGQGSSCRDRIISITWIKIMMVYCFCKISQIFCPKAGHLWVWVSIVGLESKAVYLPEDHPKRPNVGLSGELAVQYRFWNVFNVYQIGLSCWNIMFCQVGSNHPIFQGFNRIGTNRCNPNS